MTTYSQLPAATSLTGAEIFPVTQSGVTVQSTVDAMKTYISQSSPSQLAPPLNLSINIASTSGTATVTATQVTMATTLSGAIKVTSTLSESINLATTGAGGMDTGTASSGFVAIYAIYNPTTMAVDLLGTLANVAVAPEVYGGANMPSGYTYSKLLSVWPLASAGNFKAGLQQDRTVFFAEVFFTPAFALTSWTSTSIATAVPISAKSYGGRVSFSYPGGAALAGYGLSPLGNTIAQQIYLLDNSGPAQTAGSFTVRHMPIVTAQTTYYEIITTAIDSGGGFGISSYTF